MIPSRAADERHVTILAALWSAALVVATTGTWLLFRAQPGVNWALVTLSASLSLLGCARLRAGADTRDPHGRIARSAPPVFLMTLALALAMAMGGALTADVAIHAVIAFAVCGLPAIEIDHARDPGPIRPGVWYLATLPLAGGARLAHEFVRRLDETLLLATSSRWRPLVRGSALALPVVALFGLMLAPADPLLASARDQLGQFLTSWDALPRVLFFGTLFVVMVGACGLTARGSVETTAARSLAERVGIGAVERAIVLGAVTLLFAGFLVLQLSYLFGNLPGTAGSGVTFAEYARRGFAELTIVASLCVVLIAGLDHGVKREPRSWRVHIVELALLGELALLLVSAFRRLLLYEDAYGFTTARLYGQVYMVWLAVVLCLVALELRRGLDGHRVVRRAGVAAALTLTGLIYWNHEAWIVQRNVARFAATRQFDARYAVWSLSLNAVPALIAALDKLPPDAAGPLRFELTKRHGSAPPENLRWYEWNLRRAWAQRALSGLPHVPNSTSAQVPPSDTRDSSAR